MITENISVALPTCMALSALLFVSTISAQPQATYPTRPIRLLVPMAAGAGTDIGARILSTKLAEAMLQQVVVDNRAGASGIVGAELAARAAPDGHTLMVVTKPCTRRAPTMA